MKIFKNLWAGHPTWFVETSHGNGMRRGIGIVMVNRELHVRWNDSYYDSSFKESPDRFPVVGEVSGSELAEFILSKCKEA